MIKAAIIGGSGYVGGELVRLLLFHPKVKLIAVTSNSHAGEKVSAVHPHLTNVTGLKFGPENIRKLANVADVIFFALPHGVSMEKIKEIDPDNTRVIDLGADFRLKDADLFQRVYGLKHAYSIVLDKVVYGLPEINKKQIIKAKIVACPGCFPTGSLLALFPLAKAGLLGKHIVVDAKTGSSGSGIKPSAGTHHPERSMDFRAYSVFTHRHQWEIEQELSATAGSKVNIIFTAHSLPLVRGIFTSAYIFPEKRVSEADIIRLYKESYAGKSFIRLVESPRLAVVAGTNYCDIGVYVKDGKVIVTSAIDNLVKGAAGQAVQNMNIMFGLKETTGLEFPGMHP